MRRKSPADCRRTLRRSCQALTQHACVGNHKKYFCIIAMQMPCVYNNIVTNHGSVVYLLWLFIKHNTLSQWHGLYAHEQTVLPSPTCISSVPTQNNDM